MRAHKVKIGARYIAPAPQAHPYDRVRYHPCIAEQTSKEWWTAVRWMEGPLRGQVTRVATKELGETA